MGCPMRIIVCTQCGSDSSSDCVFIPDASGNLLCKECRDEAAASRRKGRAVAHGRKGGAWGWAVSRVKDILHTR